MEEERKIKEQEDRINLEKSKNVAKQTDYR